MQLEPAERALELAARFEAAHRRFVALLEGVAEAQWHVTCPNDERSVAALVQHVAWAYLVEARAFYAMATAQQFEPWTWEALHQVNADAGREHVEADRAATLDLLERNAAEAAAIVRALSADELQREGIYVDGWPPLTVDRLIERVLIGHIGEHLGSIEQATGLAANR